MNRLTFFSLYLLLLTLPAPAQLSGPPDYQTSFQAGNEAAQAGRYKTARALLDAGANLSIVEDYIRK